jgi:FKBP-type peptidyl-prolyl cis-trans isomerase FklB
MSTKGKIMMRILISSLISVLLILAAGWAESETPPRAKPGSEKGRISYSLGHQIGSDFLQQGRELDQDAFLQGVKDALGGSEPKVSREEMQSTLLEMKKKMAATRQHSEKLEMREQRLSEGEKYLAENAGRERVVVLASGLQYEVLREGKGNTPGPTDKVTVHYKGSLIDGRVIGSSIRKGEPETFYINGIMKGLSEALQLMKEGSRWNIYIPPHLALGNRGELANRTLIYDLELIKVETVN